MQHRTRVLGPRFARLVAGLRLRDAAAFLGVSESRLSLVETGSAELSSDEVDRLSSLYSCPPAVLLGQQAIEVRAEAPRIR